MTSPFSPHPSWRSHFAFKEQYPNVDSTFRVESEFVSPREFIAEPRRAGSQFAIDPVIHYFNFPKTVNS